MPNNIFEAIRADHDKQRTLLESLVDKDAAADARTETFNTLKDELKRHETAEERHFYRPLMLHDITQEKVRHGIAEHHEIDELLKKMEEADAASSEWMKLAGKLKHEVEHHLDEEEHSIFQLAGKALTEDQKNELAGAYERAMLDS